MPPILVIDDDRPARAAGTAMLRRNGAVSYDAMIVDTCLLDSAARVHALLNATPTARFVTRSQAGVMAPIHDMPDFQSMAALLAK